MDNNEPVESNNSFSELTIEEKLAAYQKKSNKFWKIVSVISLTFIIVVISINIISSRLTICDCQKSWAFIYANDGTHKTNIYNGEIYECIDINELNHCDRLIKCGDKFGKQHLNDGFLIDGDCNND